MFVGAGEALAGDSEVRCEINQGLVNVLRSFIADQNKRGSRASSPTSQGLRTWGLADFAVEINIG